MKRQDTVSRTTARKCKSDGVRTRILEIGISRLGEATGLGKSHVSRIVNGVLNPNLKTIKTISDHSGVPVGELAEYLAAVGRNQYERIAA